MTVRSRRRGHLAILLGQEKIGVELCADLAMTRQAVTKHLAVLEAANLVVSVRRGREKLHHLNPVPIAEIADRWIAKHERGRLDALVTLKKGLEYGDE